MPGVRAKLIGMEHVEGHSFMSSVISAILMVATFVACGIAWHSTGRIGYLIAGSGFLIVSPVWYQAPITYSFFNRPIGSIFKNPRKLSLLNSVLSLAGYLLIVIGAGLLIL